MKQRVNVKNITIRQFCCVLNMQFFYTRILFTVYVLRILKRFSECLPNFEIETARADVESTTCLLICLVNYISGERKQDTFNTQ